MYCLFICCRLMTNGTFMGQEGISEMIAGSGMESNSHKIRRNIKPIQAKNDDRNIANRTCAAVCLKKVFRCYGDEIRSNHQYVVYSLLRIYLSVVFESANPYNPGLRITRMCNFYCSFASMCSLAYKCNLH